MLSELLTVEDVQARYRLDDPRAARRVIRQVGALQVAGRLYVARDSLEQWEADQTASPAAAASGRRSRQRGRRSPIGAPDLSSLDPEFWKEA